MIAMIMSKTDHIDRFKTPAFFLDGDLCAFTTIDEHTAAWSSAPKRRVKKKKNFFVQEAARLVFLTRMSCGKIIGQM